MSARSDSGPAPALTVRHRTPGRVRLAVQPAEPAAVRRLAKEATGLVGVLEAVPGRQGDNLVVRFDPTRLNEETLLVRLALAHAAGFGYRPVQVEKGHREEELSAEAALAGLLSAGAVVLRAVAPASLPAAALGWAAAGIVLGTVGRQALRDLTRGAPRPEGLSLLHLLARMGGAERAVGAFQTWLLYHGPELVERLRGARSDAIEVRAVARTSRMAGDDQGTHMEILTRPAKTRGTFEGRLLSPQTLASAALGYLTFAMGQGWFGGNDTE